MYVLTLPRYGKDTDRNNHFPMDKIFKSFYTDFLIFCFYMRKIKIRFVLIKLEDDEGFTIKHFDLKVIRALELSREKELEKLQILTCCWTSLYPFLIGNLSHLYLPQNIKTFFTKS